MSADNDQYTDGWDAGYEAGLAVAKDERRKLTVALRRAVALLECIDSGTNEWTEKDLAIVIDLAEDAL